MSQMRGHSFSLNHKNVMKTHFLKLLDLFEFWVEVVGDIDII